MGRVLTEAIIENLLDLHEADRGAMPPEEVRRIEVDDALVDTGSTTLALPTRLIEQLGLKKVYEKRVRSTRGASWYQFTKPYGLPFMIGFAPST